jgi:hypothetical protein
MNNRVRFPLLRAGLLSLLCMATLAEAAPRHALTLYDEKPKYPADFKHFEYVNPDAPKAARCDRPVSAASTHSIPSSTRVSPPTTSAWSMTP